MNVMLVSQCNKRALKETRRILDQFAERRGERSWQTAITLEGLKTLHRLLRKTARKNTAVACFWIRGHNHSELMWIVGDASQFNETGATPTNTTRRDILRHEDEDDWRTGEAIRLLGALLHDLGKANIAFQNKLKSSQPVADVYRHEWVSLRLFFTLVGDAEQDRAWLERLQSLDDRQVRELPHRVERDGLDRTTPPFKNMPPLAQAIGWLIVGHHRLPMNPEWETGTKQKYLDNLPGNLVAKWCGERQQRRNEKDKEFEKLKNQCWEFSSETAFDSRQWRERAANLARRLLKHDPLFEQCWLDNPYVIHLARLGLMLADHHYSGEPANPAYGDRDLPLYANTGKDKQLKQRLDEHLIGVEINASRLLRKLPRLPRQVARIARHKGFSRRVKLRRFAWQDKAHDLSASIRERAGRQGFFGVNMASTGTGKTFANGRILYALADPKRGARFNIALGLRTLTLQTGDAYRDRLGLGSEDMAVLVGGGAIRDLHDFHRQDTDQGKDKHENEEEDKLARQGSESAEALMDDTSFVHYEGSLEEGPLPKWLKKHSQAQKLLDAPILISTIDHLMPATESTRGGHQIAPMLRLLTSDLVLDEPDDFDTGDLPALTRLVHWAGMLGGRVLLSSATLPPALVQGLFDAYRAGRATFQQNRGEPGQALNICCAWFDEFDRSAHDCDDSDSFAARHHQFVDKRLRRLARQPQRRKATVQPVAIPVKTEKDEIYPAWAGILRDTADTLHGSHHATDPKSGKRLSCGLIRMAHIEDIIATAHALLAIGAKDNSRIHLCVYHSRHPLLMRAAIEEKLDRLLNRQNENALFKQPEVRALLDQHDEPEQLFIVLASPVAEVGRDHDYDWAIVEPSSIRSIIQLAGRVRRHRGEPESDEANIALLQTNIAHLKHGMKKPAFQYPGFETHLAGHKDIPLLESHDLDELISDEQLTRIDASARIREREPLMPRNNLADLEHAQLRVLMGLEMIPDIPSQTPVTHWYQTRAHLSGELQRVQPFRDDSEKKEKNTRYYLGLDEDRELRLLRFEKQRPPTDHSGRLHIGQTEDAERITLFGDPDYVGELERLADRMDMEIDECARRFGVMDLPERRDQQPEWLYHPAFGFERKK